MPRSYPEDPRAARPATQIQHPGASALRGPKPANASEPRHAFRRPNDLYSSLAQLGETSCRDPAPKILPPDIQPKTSATELLPPCFPRRETRNSRYTGLR